MANVVPQSSVWTAEEFESRRRQYQKIILPHLKHAGFEFERKVNAKGNEYEVTPKVSFLI